MSAMVCVHVCVTRGLSQDIFRAVLKSDEHSERTLMLTGKVSMTYCTRPWCAW